MEDVNLKDAKLTIKLKAKSGYKSKIEAKISPIQWTEIIKIVEDKTELIKKPKGTKYRTTTTHPVFKEGLLIMEDETNEYDIYTDESNLAEVWGQVILIHDLLFAIKQGWIVESVS